MAAPVSRGLVPGCAPRRTRTSELAFTACAAADLVVALPVETNVTTRPANNAMMLTGLSYSHGTIIVVGTLALRAAVLAPSLRSGAAPPEVGHIPASSVGGVCPQSIVKHRPAAYCQSVRMPLLNRRFVLAHAGPFRNVMLTRDASARVH